MILYCMLKKQTQQFKEFIYSENIIKKSRCLAFITTPILLCIVFLQYFSFIPSDTAILISNIVILSILFFLILKSDYIHLWALICFIVFFINISIGGNLLGVYFFCAGLLILLKCRFFKTYLVFKTIIFACLFIAVFIYQYIHCGIYILKVSIINVVASLMLAGGLSVFFLKDIKRHYTKKEILNISALNLSKRQYKCFLYAIQGFQFKEISEKISVSESVVKKEMLKIYQTLNVKNYSEFLIFLEKYDII